MNNKRIMLAGVVAIFGMFVALLWWLVSPSWVSLYPIEVNDADKNVVIGALSEAGIDYKYDEAAKKIMIRSEDNSRAHVLLDAKGVPQKIGVGLEMFNSSDYGLSEFVQNINYQRAMEEELVRSIRLIKGIKDARVHLAVKKQSIFDEKKEEPKASVILTFNEGVTPQKNIVAGVQEIIAAAVPSLSREYIVIMSSDGKILTTGADDISGGDINGFEQKYTSLINKLLESYLGDTSFNVAVDVKLDRKKKITVAENYVPDVHNGKGFLLKSKQSEKRADADSQLGATQNQNLREEEYLYSKERSETVYPVGEVERVSVGIVIRRDLNSTEKNILRELISDSIGMDVNRGDTISLVSVVPGKAADVSSLDGKHAPQPSVSNSKSPSDNFLDKNTLIILAILIFLSVLGILFHGLRSQKLSQSKLSLHEREQLISELREWLR